MLLGSRTALSNVHVVGERMAGLAGVLSLSLEGAVRVATKQPNLINRAEGTLHANMDRLEEALGVSRWPREEGTALRS